MTTPVSPSLLPVSAQYLKCGAGCRRVGRTAETASPGGVGEYQPGACSGTVGVSRVGISVKCLSTRAAGPVRVVSRILVAVGAVLDQTTMRVVVPLYHNRLRFPQLTRHIWMLVSFGVTHVFLMDTGDRNGH